MADLSMANFPADTGPTLDNVGAVATTSGSVLIGIDTLLNPIGVAGKDNRTADFDALLERAKIAMMDYMADNLR